MPSVDLHRVHSETKSLTQTRTNIDVPPLPLSQTNLFFSFLPSTMEEGKKRKEKKRETEGHWSFIFLHVSSEDNGGKGLQ